MLAAPLVALLDIHMLLSINFILHTLREPRQSFCDGCTMEQKDEELKFHFYEMMH